MSDIVIQVENLSKYYRLGLVGTTTLEDDLHRAWAKLRGKPDPTLKIGQKDKNNGDGYIWALRDISFEVKQGEILGIIGRNGAGKSTLLKILSRVTAPTTGECRVKGRIASLLEVGTGFHPELTGRENILLNGAILGMTKEEIKQRFDEIVDFSGVEKFIDTPVKRYSSGMYVRLAFAVAAHLEPEILVIDEVLAVGDFAFQKKCLGKMGDVAKEGRTVLFVSHNMVAIQQLCEIGLWISEGQLMALGPVEDVIQTYLHTFQLQPNTFVLYNPEDPKKPMQVLSVCLRRPAHGVFSTADQLTFELEVLTRASIPGACVSVNVYDPHDHLVYWSGDTDSEWFHQPRLGRTKSSCKFAPYLLTPGRYSATVGIFAFGRGVIDTESEQRIVFEIEDRDSVLAGYGIKQRGATAIPGQWSWE